MRIVVGVHSRPWRGEELRERGKAGRRVRVAPAAARVRASVMTVVRVSLLQRMSDARLASAELCNAADGKWADGMCWLGEGWQAAAAAGLAAAADFNARDGSYVPQFASGAMQSCGVQLDVTVIDSGSIPGHTLERLTAPTPAEPHAVVGPLRSAVSEASALLLGVRDIPQVSNGPA